MRRRWLFCAAIAALAAEACVGRIGGDDAPSGSSGAGDAGPVPSTEAFTCKADATPASLPLRRLSRAQLLGTLSGLADFALPGQGAAVMNAIQAATALLPDDQKLGPTKQYGGSTRLDQSVGQDLVEGAYAVAQAFAKELAGDPARLAIVAGACATDADPSNDAACLASFVKKFGERALRRAPTDEDVAFYAQPAGAAPFDAADWQDVIAALVLSPDAQYFVESGAAPAAGAAIDDVAPYELASRLSYHFWQTLPDEELFAKARSGELSKPDVYAKEVDRVFADPRTRDAIRQMYAEWLHRDDVAEISSRVGTPAFDTLRGSFNPGPELREHMFDELADMGVYYSLDAKSPFSSLYTSKKSFAKTQDLAGLYGVPVWDGAGAPPDFVEPARVGLLTRAAMVATGSANTRPIMKGVFVRKALLCDDVPPPPPNVNPKPIEPMADATSREEVAALTEQGVCAGCHKTLINPLGYVTEDFDAIGRFRTEELLIDGKTGMLKGKRKVDTSAVTRVRPDDDRTASGAEDASRWILESGKAEACFARVYFRFTFGRAEDVAQDGCALADLDKALLDGDDLGSVLKRVALSPAFRQKNFGAAK